MNSCTEYSGRTSLSRLLSFFTGATIGIITLLFLGSSIKPIKFDELALGKETRSYFPKDGERYIHCQEIADGEQCINGYKSTSYKDVVVWLGNSQVHAINQMSKGDFTASLLLYKRLQGEGKYFMTFSQPNASLQEHYLLFEYLTEKLPVSTLILPLVFDDMRETGIRPGLATALSEPVLREKLKKTVVGKMLIKNHGKQDSAGNDMAALTETLQEKSEFYLNSTLEDNWLIWRERPLLRGSLMFSLYRFRNWIFGINPSSTRKMITGRYNNNRKAFETILEVAEEGNIKVLVYIVPLRNDVKVPYDLNEYSFFKKEMRSVAEKYGARFVNFEGLVPSEYWGTKQSTSTKGGSELDFMHFQAAGHKMLANALYQEMTSFFRIKKGSNDL